MQKRPPDRSVILLLIALFKLLKAALLIVVGLGLLHLRNKNLNETLIHWANTLGVDPHGKYFNRMLEHTLNISRKKLEVIGLGTFVYAAMFGTEGTGLLLGKRWAEYMVILTTAGLLPLEIYEIAIHSNWLKIATLIVNVLALIYLVVRIRMLKQREHAAAAALHRDVAIHREAAIPVGSRLNEQP